MIQFFKKRDGYIALASVLIIMAFALILVVGVALTSFLTRGTSSLDYHKEISRALAESCVQTALLKLAANINYAGGETVTVATTSVSADTCSILAIAASGTTQKIIPAEASFERTITNLRTTINISDFAIAGTEEL